MSFVWLFLGLAHADGFCEGDVVAKLEAAMVEVQQQYTAIDESGFDRAAKQLDATVTCLVVEPPGATVARLHQAEALVAFVNGQKGAARRAMIAARLADPTWKLDGAQFPKGHPYRQLWAGATDAGPVEPIGEAPTKSWVVDGIVRDEAPTERAFLLQVREGSGISYAEYLYDFDDIPDLGQDTSDSAWEVPRRLRLVGLAGARVLDADQTATGPGLSDQSAGALGGGGALLLRANPIAFVGVEAAVGSFGGADPLLGGSFALEAHAVGLFGAATPLSDELQLYGAGRFGYARDTVIAWANGASGTEQTLWPMNNVVGGAEAGVRGESLDLRAVSDLLFGGGGLYEVRGGATGTLGLGDSPLALELGLSARGGSLELTGAGDAVVGERSDVELRVMAGPVLWFE